MGNKNSTMNQTSAVCGKLTGGLGNQLFIIAATYAYALENNLRFFVSKDWPGISKSRPNYWDTLLTNVTQLLEWKRAVGTRVYKEIKFSYDKIPVFNHNIILDGFFQSDKYFKNYETEIRELFKLPESLKEFAVNKLNSLFPNSKIGNPTLVAVHIRRGDYIKNPKVHYLQPISYYLEAQEFMEKKLGYRPVYVYFSDDKDFVTKNFNLNENDVIVSCDKDYEEFAVMQQCHHFIIANSTFSWWAAWLSEIWNKLQKITNIYPKKDKLVIAPENWFGLKGSQNWHDIYPQTWIILFNIVSNSYLHLRHQYWTDFLNVNLDMSFYRNRIESEKGIVFKNGNKYVTLWNNWNAENTQNQLTILGECNDKIEEMQNQNIQSRLILNKGVNPYNLYLINLEHRTDRKESFLHDLPKNIFNVNFFKAVKHVKGAHGCGLSHMYLIKYAKDNNLPYIIVAEDDALFKVDSEKILEVLNLLTNNLDKWNVFNGAPSFSDKSKHEEELIFTKSFNDLFINSNWGQSTSFMIYNSNSYDEVLNYNFTEQIDQFFSKNFTQTIYSISPFSIQKASFSDIGGIYVGKEYERFFIEQYDIIKKSLIFDNINNGNDDINTLGVYGIFIGTYSKFYKDFIENFETNFYPGKTKYYYIVTDQQLEKYNDRTFFFNTEKIGWPYETLYRFKYFLQFNREDINKSEYVFFVNSNGKLLHKVTSGIISENYTFTRHHRFWNKSYKEMTYEKDNKNSTAYIPLIGNFKYEYYAGGFLGAKTNYFIEMCNILDKNITTDEQRNYIAEWHDESHINKYCFDLIKNGVKFRELDYRFHTPEEEYIKDRFHDAILIYLDKNTHVGGIKKIKGKVTHGKVIKNKWN